MTHEQFIHKVREFAVSRITDQVERQRLLSAKLTYGSGPAGHRGICFFGAWQQNAALEFIEICANGEESPMQLAGTTLHELAHCMAGPASGHGGRWRAGARSLGLMHALAAGQSYSEADFDPVLRANLRTLPSPSDGRPAFPALRRGSGACPVGAGTRGGKTRGPGSGSRLRLFICDCDPPVRVRVARDEGSFSAWCLICDSAFKRVRALPAAPVNESLVSVGI